MIWTRFGCLGLLVLLIGSVSLEGQQGRAPVSKKKTDLSYSFGLQLGTSGTNYTSEFSLMDDLGFHYDVMSLLKDSSVREEIKLSDAQLAKMKKFKAELNKELSPAVINGVASVEFAKSLEARVKAAEIMLLDELDAWQITRLEQVKTQLRIEKSGIAKLASSRFLTSELNLSEEQAESLRKAIKIRQNTYQQELRKLYSEANQKIFSELEASSQSRIRKTVSPEFLKSLMNQKPFVKKPRSRYRSAPTGIYLMDLLNDTKLCATMDLTQAQQEDLNKLKAKFEDRLAGQMEELLSGDGKLLSITQRGKQLHKLNLANRRLFAKELRTYLIGHQYKKLVESAMQAETSRLGTVQCFCNGVIAQQVGLKDAEAERVYLAAIEIQKKLQFAVGNLTSKFESEIFQMLPNFDVAQKLGSPFRQLRR